MSGTDGEFVDVLTTGRSAGGRDREFTAFMAEHAGELRRTAWLLVGDLHRAEELTQERTGPAGDVFASVSTPRVRAAFWLV